MTTKRITDKGGGIITTILAGACLWLASATIPIGAAIMDVTTTADEVTVNTFCSLREAIINANDNAQTNADCPAGEAVVADIINVPAGLYTLTITGVDENPSAGAPWEAVIDSDASMGDLDITDDVTITGAGPGSTIIQWAVTPPGFALDPATNLNPTLAGRNDRIFHIRAVDATIGNVTLSGMTLLNGDVGLIPSSATDVCVFDDINSLWVYDTDLENAYDLAHTGSCIDASDPDAVPDLVITQFRRWGGAIAIGDGAAIVDYEQAIHGPGGGGGGGEGKKPPVLPPPEDESAFSVESVSYNQLVIVSNWSGADAGGIFNIAAGTISQSAISGNFSGGNGGGLYNDADLTISDSLIGKVFDADTLALYPQLGNGNQGENGGGMFYTGVGAINIIRSAFNGNQGIGGGAIAGRAMGVLSILNSTISSNIGSDVGGGITTNGAVILRSSTVANNLASTDAPGGGAGLNAFGPGNYAFNNTILANNIVSSGEGGDRLANCGCSGGSPDCSAGIMVSQGYNLEDGDTCDLGLTGDLLNTDPLLQPLADNGGLTETHLIPHTYVLGGVDNSPAVDAGDNTTCPNNDQRSSIRPADGDGIGNADCDIGAFELSALSTDLQIANMVAPDEVFKTDNYTVTVTVLNNGADDTNVALTFDTLPAGVTFVSAIPSAGTCSEVGGDVSCDIGTLANNESATVPLTLTADAVGDVTIAANVTSDTEDGTEPNNSASVNTAIIGIADLALSATANTSSVVVGNQVTLTFTVANLDDPLSDVDGDLATEVRLYGTIPPEATLISATPDNGTTCTQTGADVVCALGNLAVAGPTINVVAVLRADEAGRVADVSASVDAKQRDPIESNNTVTASVTITSVPTGGSDSGGLCSYDPNGRFDPVLPLLVMLSLIYLARRRRVATQ
jgi:CSLREA domain-containing protein